MIEMNELPAEIRQDSEDLLNELRSAGWEISAAMYEASFFGDWFVDLQRGEKSIRLIKENALFTFQNLVEIEPEAIDSTHHENFATFHKAVSHWAGTDGPSLVR